MSLRHSCCPINEVSEKCPPWIRIPHSFSLDNNMASKTTKLGGAASDVVIGKTAVSSSITRYIVASRLNRFVSLARSDDDDVRCGLTSCYR